MTNNNKAERALEWLKHFNRKERYHLLCDALFGREDGGKNGFQLQPEFIERLNGAGITGIPDNGDAFVAMDYHLDWIAAALVLAEEGKHASDGESLKSCIPNYIAPRSEQGSPVITGNQEDTDLLIAFANEDCLHLILIEAKVESGWDGGQIQSKGKRLREIFGGDGKAFPFAEPRFVLAGPGVAKRAPRLDKRLEGLPDFFFRKEKEGEKGSRTPDDLYRIDLCVQQSLYKPTRFEGTGAGAEKWRVDRTYRYDKKNGKE